MDNIRKIIRNILNEELEFQNDFGNKEKAKEALMAFSKGLIKGDQIKEISGSFSPETHDFSSDGHKTQSAEDVIFIFNFEGKEYNFTLNLTGEFYLTVGHSGKWGSSIDTSEPPESSDISDEKIIIENNKIIVQDQDDNEYEFGIMELGTEFVKNLESLLYWYYDVDESEMRKGVYRGY